MRGEKKKDDIFIGQMTMMDDIYPEWKDKAIMESWRNFMRDIMEADKLKQKEGGADDAGTGKP